MGPVVIRLLAVVLSSAGLPGAGAVTIGAEHGVALRQQVRPGAGGSPAPTAIGRFELDLVKLRQNTGQASGYVNMATAEGWVVRNLPVPAEESFAYGKLSVSFRLGSQASISTLSASVDYSTDLKLGYSASTLSSYGVTPLTISIGGAGTTATTGAPQPPNLNDILFGDPTGNDTVTQFDHPNIEAAHNACMPTAVANSLQFLEDTTGLVIPHEHKPGLKPSVSPGDDSLVGQIEEAMGRSVTDRRHGQGVWGLQGKLKYLAGNGLAGRVSVQHWGDGGPDAGNANVSVVAGGATARSTGRGKTVNFDAVLQAMREGQNCEVVYSWPEGAHAVDLVAAGKSRGQPWIVHGSDIDQASDSAGAGPSGFEFAYLNDPDKDGLLNLNGGNEEIVQVICEKYVPPPPTVTVIETIDPAGHSCCVNPPPTTVTVTISGTTMSINGSGASWLPLNGTITTSGSFNLASTRTVAGFPNVLTRFTGTRSGNSYEGRVDIGALGELFGTPISHRLRIDESVPDAKAAMRLNGMRHTLEVAAGEPVKPSISMRASTRAGTAGEWWLVAGTADGQFFHLDLATLSWQPGLLPTYTGALMDLPYFGLPVLPALPAGRYDFYFGFDPQANGVPDLDSIFYERTTLTVRP